MEKIKRKNTGYIYRIHNKETGRSYVGQTNRSVERRWKEHRKDLKGNKHHCASLQEAWNSFEKDVFLFENILECEREELTEKEQEVWDREENPYNGRPTDRAYPEPTPETRKKWSLATSGENNPLFGRHGKDSPVSKPVLQYDLEGNFIAEYETGTEAEKKTGVSHCRISMCCRGKKYKSVGGYIWKFKVGEETKEKIEPKKPRADWKPVLQYDNQGNFITEYESISKAARATGILAESISNVVRKDLRDRIGFAGTFYWRYKIEDEVKEKIGIVREAHHLSKPILQYDKEGNLLAEYESGVEAERETGVDKSSISRNCKGKEKSAGGFIWRYKDQHFTLNKVLFPTEI